MHALAWSSRRKRAGIAKKDPQNVVELHFRRPIFTTGKNNSEFEEHLVLTLDSMNSTFVLRNRSLGSFSLQNCIDRFVHSGYLSLIFFLIFAIAAVGSLKLDSEIIEP